MPSSGVPKDAGPELDALVASVVFGKQPCDEWHLFHAGMWTPNEGHDPDAHCCYPSQRPVQYSQLIQAAWLVVEKMRERWFTCVNLIPDDDPDKAHGCNYECEIFGSVAKPARGYADTASLAICRAALAASADRSEG